MVVTLMQDGGEGEAVTQCSRITSGFKSMPLDFYILWGWPFLTLQLKIARC